MSTLKNNQKNENVFVKRAKEPRYLMVDWQIWDKLSPYALKVYGQLRKLTDFKQDHDEVKLTVEKLSKLSEISVRKTYDVLNELENEHHLIQRMNYIHNRYGQTNSYDVSQTYGFFKSEEPQQQQGLEGVPVQNLTTPAQYAGRTARGAYSDLNSSIPIEDLKEKIYKKEKISSVEYQEVFYEKNPGKELLAKKQKASCELSIQDLLADNPHAIPRENLEEWQLIRKKRRAPITVTVWRMMNAELSKCLSNAIQAFIEMISRGWSTVKAEWLKNPRKVEVHEDSAAEFMRKVLAPLGCR